MDFAVDVPDDLHLLDDLHNLLVPLLLGRLGELGVGLRELCLVALDEMRRLLQRVAEALDLELRPTEAIRGNQR